MAEIGSLVVDLTLKFAEFTKDLDKVGNQVGASAKRMQGSLEKIKGTFDAVGKAIAGLLTIRFIRAIDRMVKESLRLAASLGASSPLGRAAQEFLDKAEAFSNAFQLGVAKGFIDSLQQGLQTSNVSLNDLAAAGLLVGNVLGKIFTSIVNFLTHDIPDGVRASIASFNQLIGSFNGLVAGFNSANESLNNSAVGRLLGFSGTQGNLPTIPLLDTTGIESSIQSWQDLAAASGIAGASIQLTTEGQRQMNIAAQEFAHIAQLQNTLYKDIQTPMEAYRERLSLISASQLDATSTAKLQTMAQAELANTWLDAAGAIGNSLTSLFKDNKAVAIASAVINTAEAITAALKNPPGPPFSFAYAAAAAAAGAAQIATILSTNPGSSKAVKTPTAKAAPVKAGAASSGAGTAQRAPQSSVNITVHGDFYTPETMRRILTGLNGVIADGAKLNVSAR